MKMQSVIILSLTYILSSSLVMAQETKQVETTTVTESSKATSTMSQAPQRLRKSSYENRIDKNATIALGLGFEMGEMGQLINADIFLDADSLLSFRVTYADDEYNDDFNDGVGARDRDTQFTTSVQFKQFVSNSFYLKAGLFYRDLKEEDNRAYLFSDETSTYRLKDMGLTFSLGNQWNFNKFTIGCDWFGLTNRMKKISENGSGDFYSISNDKVAINLLTFYAGISF